MALSLLFSSVRDCPTAFLSSDFLHSNSSSLSGKNSLNYKKHRKHSNLHICISCSSTKIVRSPSLDRHVVKQNKIRFVQKLKTLLLSKPKHYVPLHILSKCRAYLSIPKPRSLLSMIHRYPSIFELFTIPLPPTPLNATKLYPQLCVRLTPAASSLATQELNLKSAMSITLANKLQKLLMLSSHHMLLLTKLVHLAPNLGLPPNFRSRLCNDHPNKFKTVDTSYGRALELVSWDPDLSKPLSSPQVHSHGLIVDRPLKFKQLRLRKGLNLKRSHQEFLIKLRDMPDVCPYNTPAGELAQESLEAEKRACAVVREMLGMMVEKRTLIDHLTHFRKEFGLPNKLRGMIMRHPELFYVSLKGQRDSVFLVEGYDDKGVLLEKDESLVIKNELLKLVREGKRIIRERRKSQIYSSNFGKYQEDCNDDYEVEGNDNDDYDDGFESLFESEDTDLEDGYESSDLLNGKKNGEFWTANTAGFLNDVNRGCIEPW